MVRAWEAAAAGDALEGFGPGVFPVVSGELVGSSEAPVAVLPCASVRLLACKKTRGERRGVRYSKDMFETSVHISQMSEFTWTHHRKWLHFHTLRHSTYTRKKLPLTYQIVFSIRYHFSSDISECFDVWQFVSCRLKYYSDVSTLKITSLHNKTCVPVRRLCVVVFLNVGGIVWMAVSMHFWCLRLPSVKTPVWLQWN